MRCSFYSGGDTKLLPTDWGEAGKDENGQAGMITLPLAWFVGCLSRIIILVAEHLNTSGKKR